MHRDFLRFSSVSEYLLLVCVGQRECTKSQSSHKFFMCSLQYSTVDHLKTHVNRKKDIAYSAIISPSAKFMMK